MYTVKNTTMKLCVLIVIAANYVMGHTWLLNPTPRHDNLCIPVFDNSNCCKPAPGGVLGATYQRGQIISTSWGRNNHVGGFIRYTIVPLSQSDNPGVFENDAAVFQYNCYAPQCVGSGGNFFAGDPGGTPFNANQCSMNLRIPDWLPDGQYTIQWRWHSGGDNYNTRNLGLLDFVSCHDFNIAGGPLGTKPGCPLFIGGDASDPTKNACEFFKGNDINTCTVERDCYSWYGKAPPKAITECPTNILPGGMISALNGVFEPGQPLPLYIGRSSTPITNPGTVEVDFSSIYAQIANANTTITVPSATTTYSYTATRTITQIVSGTSSPLVCKVRAKRRRN